MPARHVFIRAMGCYVLQACFGCTTMKKSTIALTIVLLALCAAPHSAGAQSRPRSILVLDQSEPRGPFYFQIFTSIRAELNADARALTSLYAENLDLTRFNGMEYEDSLRRQLKQKYRD